MQTFQLTCKILLSHSRGSHHNRYSFLLQLPQHIYLCLKNLCCSWHSPSVSPRIPISWYFFINDYCLVFLFLTKLDLATFFTFPLGYLCPKNPIGTCSYHFNCNATRCSCKYLNRCFLQCSCYTYCTHFDLTAVNY